MAQSVIGALRVNLGLDSANFQSGARRAQSTAQRLGRSMQLVGAAVSAVGTGISLAIRAQIGAASEMGRLAQVSNTSVEQFQRYAAGARTVGIESEKLSDILKDVTDRVGDFMQTGGGPMADFFENIAPRVGVTADMFRDLSGADALQLYVSSLEAANLSQAEMTFYLEAMASDTTALIPLLANGGAEMQRLGDAAQRAGTIMSGETVQAARAFNEQIDRLWAAITSLTRQITASLIPILSRVTEWLANAAGGWARLSPEMQTFAAAIAGITVVAGPALIAMGAIVRALGSIRVAVALAAGPWGILAGLVVAAAGYFLVFRNNAGEAGTAAEETALAMDSLNTAMGVFYNSASPATARGAIEAANGLRQQASAARDAAASQLALIEAENAAAEQRLADGGGVMPFGTALGENNRLAAQVELDRARASLIEAELAANRAVRAVTGSMSEQMTATAGLTTTTNELAVSLNSIGSGGGGAAVDALDNIGNAAAETETTLHSVGQSLAGVFTDALMKTKSLSEGLRDLLRSLASTLLNRAFSQMFGNIFPSLNLAGARAMGGPVAGGESYLVGEGGAEIFTPGSSGHITPNHAIGGGGSQTVNIINNSGQEARQTSRTGPDGQQILDIEIGRSISRGRQDAAMSRYNAKPAGVRR